MGKSTGFHTDQAWRDVGKKGKHFYSLELIVKQLLAVLVNSVDLENLFRQIGADSLNVHDGRSAQVVTIDRATVAQDVVGDHSIKNSLGCSDYLPQLMIPYQLTTLSVNYKAQRYLISIQMTNQ